MQYGVQDFLNQISHKNNFKWFLFKNLPSAWMSGAKLSSIDQYTAEIILKETWFNKNPFHSIYFAPMLMAAELSAGVLCMAHLYGKTPCSMLLTAQSSEYLKKAKGVIKFICSDGEKINQAIQNAIQSLAPAQVECFVTAFNDEKQTVAKFSFTWSFKVRQFPNKNLA